MESEEPLNFGPSLEEQSRAALAELKEIVETLTAWRVALTIDEAMAVDEYLSGTGLTMDVWLTMRAARARLAKRFERKKR